MKSQHSECSEVCEQSCKEALRGRESSRQTTPSALLKKEKSDCREPRQTDFKVFVKKAKHLFLENYRRGTLKSHLYPQPEPQLRSSLIHPDAGFPNLDLGTLALHLKEIVMVCLWVSPVSSLIPLPRLWSCGPAVCVPVCASSTPVPAQSGGGLGFVAEADLGTPSPGTEFFDHPISLLPIWQGQSYQGKHTRAHTDVTGVPGPERGGAQECILEMLVKLCERQTRPKAAPAEWKSYARGGRPRPCRQTVDPGVGHLCLCSQGPVQPRGAQPTLGICRFPGYPDASTLGGQALLCLYSLTRTYFIGSRPNTVSTARLQSTADSNILNAPVIELPFHKSTLEHNQEQAVPHPFNRYVS